MDIAGVVSALQRRARTGSAAPLLTHYDLATGGRTELSVATYANWVAKTANLIEDLGADEEVVSLALARERPGHWMTLIWPLAAWQRGCRITLDDAGDLLVVGPIEPRPVLPGRTIACSLHPLGLGLRGLAAGVLDFTGEALAQPDAAGALAVDEAAIAWSGADGERSFIDLLAVQPVSERVLVRPTQPFATLAHAVIGPLLGGGSAVVVEGDTDAARLEAIRASERCVP
jgi:uncharacterized protein (TIGR03089 family)